jgi:hypothetical protein
VDDDEHDETEQPTYGLVMPFVVCVSNGGPFDDEAFVAGYECGMLSTRLDGGPNVLIFTAHTANVPQLDLIAMQRGYRMIQEPTDFDEWTGVTFERTS